MNEVTHYPDCRMAPATFYPVVGTTFYPEFVQVLGDACELSDELEGNRQCMGNVTDEEIRVDKKLETIDEAGEEVRESVGAGLLARRNDSTLCCAADDMEAKIRHLSDAQLQLKQEVDHTACELMQQMQALSSSICSLENSRDDLQERVQTQVMRLEIELDKRLSAHENDQSSNKVPERSAELESSQHPLDAACFARLLSAEVPATQRCEKSEHVANVASLEQRIQDLSLQTDGVFQDMHDSHWRLSAHETQLGSLRELLDSHNDELSRDVREQGAKIERDFDHAIGLLREGLARVTDRSESTSRTVQAVQADLERLRTRSENASPHRSGSISQEFLQLSRDDIDNLKSHWSGMEDGRCDTEEGKASELAALKFDVAVLKRESTKLSDIEHIRTSVADSKVLTALSSGLERLKADTVGFRSDIAALKAEVAALQQVAVHSKGSARLDDASSRLSDEATASVVASPMVESATAERQGPEAESKATATSCHANGAGGAETADASTIKPSPTNEESARMFKELVGTYFEEYRAQGLTPNEAAARAIQSAKARMNI